MMTLLASAVNGWTDYIQHGKYAALLIAAILYLGYRIRKQTGEAGEGQSASKILYLYAALSAAACICPVTALILMKYQTAFYAYVWIWSLVPMTALIAWAAADFLDRLWTEKNAGRIPATLLLLGIVILSGNPLSEGTGTQLSQIPAPAKVTASEEEATPWEVLEMLAVYHYGENPDREFCIWAPKAVMAQARAFSADIRPVYGRSIWDAALGSYSYDTYELWQEDLYLWMNHLEATGETEYVRMDGNDGERTIDFAYCLDRAEEAGVDYILLPENMPEETTAELTKTLGNRAALTRMAGYYMIEWT